MIPIAKIRWICSGLAIVALFMAAQNTPKVNPDSLVAKEFTDRVSEYVALHKKADGKVPPQKPTESADAIAARQKALAVEIRSVRPNAKQGEIFTPEAAALFQKLLATSFHNSEGGKVRASLRRAEPVKQLPLRINGEYPETAPLQSTPPSVLSNLPPLPKEVEYRIVGRDLVLLDIGANIVVDVARGIVPSATPN